MRVLAFILFQMLATSSVAFDMKCKMVDNSWYIIGNVTNCFARNVNIQKPDQIVDSVNGSNNTQEDVLAFWVENEICHYIPQKIVAFFPKLKAFGIQNSGLRTLSKFDIQPFPDLIILALYGNNLEYLDGDLFTFNTKIQSFKLEDNHLLIINGPLLKPLTNLNQVMLRLQCLSDKCEYSNCIPDFNREFSEKCEFDSLYPGFINYVSGIKSISESCNRIED